MNYRALYHIVDTHKFLIIAFFIVIIVLTLLIAIIDHARHKKIINERLYATFEDQPSERFEPDIEQRDSDEQAPIRIEPIQNDVHDIVSKSTVIIYGSQGCAIALYYDMDQTDVPIVVYKGREELADRIIQLAQKARIPLVEDQELANDLYLNIKVNEPISANFHKSIAKIIRQILGYERAPSQITS